MKKVLSVLILALIVISCSGVKVIDSWKGDEIGDLADAKIQEVSGHETQ